MDIGPNLKEAIEVVSGCVFLIFMFYFLAD
jgi:hypothetical protein